MWRTCTRRSGQQIVGAAKRRVATESAQGSVPPPPPPKLPPVKKSGGFGLLKALGLGVPAVGGGVVGYAWFDPKFRKQVEANVPLAKDLLGFVLPLPEPEVVPVRKIKKEDALPSLAKKKVVPVVEEKAPETPAVEPPPVAPSPIVADAVPEVLPSTTDVAADVPSTELLAESLVAEPQTEQKTLKKETVSMFPTVEDIEKEILLRQEIEKSDNAALEVAIHNLLTASEELTSEAVKAQQAVAECCRSHSELLKQAMDDTSDIQNKDGQWGAVALAFREKDKAIQRSNELVNKSKRSIEKLQDLLAESKNNNVTQNNAAIYPATKKVVELTNNLGTANAKVRQAESESKVLMKYKDLVDKGKKQFQMELESIMPEVSLGNTSKKLTEDELNSLIAHAHRRIEQLQKQLAEQMALEKQRVAKALEAQKQEDQGMAEAAVAEERLRLQNEFAVEKYQLDLQYLANTEAEVRKQLSRQAAAHSDHIRDVLAVQREQMSLEFNRELQAKVLQEREEFQAEVYSWISRLKGIESAIDARASGEKAARAAQDLWLACISLNSLLHFGDEEETALIPIRKEVENVISVSNRDPYVEIVAQSLPEVALDRGVYTEEQLRHRFVKVSKVCRKLGLVTESNASLYKYLISFLHSYVVFDNVTITSPSDTLDLNTIDNYGLVAHAQYWMQQGDLAMALKFMSQLTGESSVAASDWVNEARLLLEAKQAAVSLTAYASASGLANTF